MTEEIKDICHNMKNDAQVLLFALDTQSSEEEKRRGRYALKNLCGKIDNIADICTKKGNKNAK